MTSTNPDPITARCGRSDPHRAHAQRDTFGTFCAGNLDIITAQPAPGPRTVRIGSPEASAFLAQLPEPTHHEGPRYDYVRQVWLTPAGAVMPCAHPESMGPDCCNAYKLTGERETEGERAARLARLAEHDRFEADYLDADGRALLDGDAGEPFELDAADRRELDGGSWARALRNANASRQRQYARDKLAAAESGTADRALDARIATFVPDTHHLNGSTIPPHLWPAVLYPALGAYWSHALAGGEAIRYALGHPGELVDDYTDGVRIRRNGGRYPYVEGPPFPGQKLTD